MRRMAYGSGEAHDHGGGAALRVAPGAMSEIVVTLAQAGVLEMSSLLPGHFEAGKRVSVAVGTQPVAN